MSKDLRELAEDKNSLNSDVVYDILMDHINHSYVWASLRCSAVLPAIAVWSVCRLKEINNPGYMAITDSFSCDSDMHNILITHLDSESATAFLSVSGHGCRLTEKDFISDSGKISSLINDKGIKDCCYIYCDEPYAVEQRKIEKRAAVLESGHYCRIRLVSINKFLKRCLPDSPEACAELLYIYYKEIMTSKHGSLTAEHSDELKKILGERGISIELKSEAYEYIREEVKNRDYYFRHVRDKGQARLTGELEIGGRFGFVTEDEFKDISRMLGCGLKWQKYNHGSNSDRKAECLQFIEERIDEANSEKGDREKKDYLKNKAEGMLDMASSLPEGLITAQEHYDLSCRLH